MIQPDQAERVQEALTRSAGALISEVSADRGRTALDERLRRLTGAALANIPGADAVGLTMQESPGGLTSYGQTDDASTELDRLQVAAGEGPCLDALAGAGRLVDVADFAEETRRWPRFAPAAVDLGVRSLVSFTMGPAGATPGALNVYSRSPAAFDRTAKTIAGAFAMQAAIAVYGVQRIAHLEQAVQTRDTIGQAKGILMERHGLTGERAFEMLMEASQNTNIKLVEVARWVVGEVGRLPSRPPDRRRPA